MREQRTLLHRTSRKSFACVEDELKQKSYSPITRCDVWLHAYEPKEKDSTEDIEDPEAVKKVKENMAKQASSQTSQSLKDDVVSQALGPDRRGRVRGYGFGATPSKIDGQSHTSNKVTMLEKALLANTEELKELRMLVTSLLTAQSNKGDNKNETSSAQHSSMGNRQSRQVNATAVSKKRKEEDRGVGGSGQEGRKQAKKTHAVVRSTTKEKEGGSVTTMKKL